ncbi:MAG: glycosyltransferase [Deltaproteobacteria bacterium]|nr:glycosyltransferase [Deltaproteobacteria bacterium]
MISENDPAGVAITFTKALNQHTEHRCRLVTCATRYNFDFEKDLHVPDLTDEGFDELRYTLAGADIFHFHILADENLTLGPLRVQDFVLGKAILHHHHGHPHFRANPGIYRDKYRKLRRKVLVSTPDLLKLLPEARWQPNPVPVNDPRYLPADAPRDGKVRVCQSPTRKEIKDTNLLLSAVSSLRKNHPELEAVIVENKPHAECLRIKQGCDIHFDHMQGYFGVSSLEGLSQGKPVIAGLDDWNLSHIKEFTGRENSPWVIARNERHLEKGLKDLLNEPEKRTMMGRESRYFMETVWTEKATESPKLNEEKALP